MIKTITAVIASLAIVFATTLLASVASVDGLYNNSDAFAVGDLHSGSEAISVDSEVVSLDCKVDDLNFEAAPAASNLRSCLEIASLGDTATDAVGSDFNYNTTNEMHQLHGRVDFSPTPGDNQPSLVPEVLGAPYTIALRYGVD